MKNLNKIILVVFTIFISFSANAKYFTPLSGPGVEITKLFTHLAGGVTLYISGSVLNLDDCPVTSRVHLKGDLQGHNNMVSAALMAFASGKKLDYTFPVVN